MEQRSLESVLAPCYTRELFTSSFWWRGCFDVVKRKSALGIIRHWCESWHGHSTAVCPWTSCVTSLCLPSFLCDENPTIYLTGWWEDEMISCMWKYFIKCETVHRRDTRMTRVMVSSEVCAGTYLGCFLALLGSPGPTHLIWGREIWRCVSRGLGVLRTLRNNRDTREGIQFRFFLYTDLE